MRKVPCPPSRSAALVALLALALVSIADCGSNGSATTTSTGHGTQQAAQTQTAATTSAAQTASQTAKPFAPAATWHFAWTMPGGYRYTGTLSMSKPAHIESSVVAPCEAEPSRDAQVQATATLVNATRSYPGAPDLAFQLLGTASLAQNGQCSKLEGTEANIGVGTAEPIAPGSSVTSQFVLILANYYSPEHPNGETSSLGGYSFQTSAIDPHEGANSHGVEDVTGPATTSFGPNTMTRFSLAPLAR